MKNDFTFPSKDGVTTVYATEWIPDGEIKAVLQICHGMCEYIGRYADFAQYLAENGFYVVGNDHIGHGRSVTDDSRHGYFKNPDGLECAIEDMQTLRKLTEEKYPGKPYFILGHSMGSFFTRKYLTHYGEGLRAAVIMGTGTQSPLTLKLGMKVCRDMAKIKGWDHRSKLVTAMAFGSYSKKIENPRTNYDWITKDEKIVEKYAADPFCTYTFTLDGYYQMFRAIAYVTDKENIRKTADIPLFFVAGEEDPVGAYGDGVRKTVEDYRAAGKNVKMKLYPSDRHEILNETDRESVYADIKEFFEENL